MTTFVQIKQFIFGLLYPVLKLFVILALILIIQNMLTKTEFNRLNLGKRYELLTEEGRFIASRFFEGFNVHLFAVYGFYVEMWQRISISQVVYIEVVNNDETLKLYIENIDLKKDLGL